MIKCYNKNIEPYKTLFSRYSEETAYYVANLMDTHTYQKDWTFDVIIKDNILYAKSKTGKLWNIDAEVGYKQINTEIVDDEGLFEPQIDYIELEQEITEAEKYVNFAFKNKDKIISAFKEGQNKFTTQVEMDDAISGHYKYTVNPRNFLHNENRYYSNSNNNNYKFFKNNEEIDAIEYNKALINYVTNEEIRKIPIDTVELRGKEYRNKGYGISMYILKGEEALENGAYLVSDNTLRVSWDAQKVWNNLVRLGLAVEDSPLKYRYTGMKTVPPIIIQAEIIDNRVSNSALDSDEVSESLQEKLDRWHKEYEIREVNISDAPDNIQKKLEKLDNDGDGKIERYVNKLTGQVIWERVSDAQTLEYGKYRSKEEITAEENSPRSIIAREVGTEMHFYMQNRIVDLAKNFKNINVGNRKNLLTGKEDIFTITTELHRNKLDKLLNNILTRISKNGGGTIYTEQLMIDDIIGGSMDILVLHPGNKFSIYDYKFIESSYYDTDLKREVYTDKVISTKSKMESYNKQISAYAKRLKDYGLEPLETLIIPVSRRQQKNKGKINKKVENIGTLLDSRENLNYIPVANMQTKDERLKELVGSLYDELSKLEKDYNDDSKIRSIELRKAIQGIVVDNDITFLLESAYKLATVLNNKLPVITKIEDLLYYKELLAVYEQLNLDLIDYVAEKETYRELRDKLELLEIQINEKEFELVQNSSNEKGIQLKTTNLKELTWWERMTYTLSDISNPIFRYFYQLLESANSKIYNNVIKVANELEKYKELTQDDFDFLISEKGNLKSEISQEFYSEMQDALKDGDYDWFRENVVFNKEKYEKDYNRKKDSLIKLGYGEDFVKDKLTQFERLYNPELVINGKKNKDAYMTSDFVNKYHNYQDEGFRDKYKSDFMKELENRGGLLKEFYDYYTEKIGEYAKVLYAADINIKRNFIPNIHKNLIESGDWYKWIYEPSAWGKRLMEENLQIKEIGDEVYGAEDRVPVLYISNVKDKSFDLAKSLLLFTKTVENYKYKTEIEPLVQSLGHLVEKQKVIKTNKWGKPIQSFGVPLTEYSEKNVKAFNRFVKMNIYGQSLQDKDWAFTLGKEGEKKTISISKGIQFLMRFMSLKDLGYNPISATVNSLSNRFNAYMIGKEGQYFKSSQFKDSTNLLSINDTKFWAINQWLDINKSIEYKGNQLSKFYWNNDRYINNAMLLTSEPEEALRRSISIAFLKNHTLDNGNIVKLREGDTPLYDLIEAKETEDGMELTIDNKPISEVIPTEIYFKHRAKTLKLLSKITGSVNEDDKNLYRTYILGQIIGQYRSWIPRVIESRWGKFRYDHLMEDYQVGRYQLFLDNFTEHTWLKMKELGKTLGQAISFGLYNSEIRDEEGLKKSAFIHLYNKAKLENPKLTKKQFQELVLAKQKGLIAEARLLMFATAMYWGIWAMFKGEGDDEDSWLFKQQQRVNKKLLSELMFNFDVVNSVPEIIKSPFPMYRLAQDFSKNFVNIGDEARDFYWGENSSQDKSPLAYYSIQMIPVANVLYKLSLDLPSDENSYFDPKKGETGIQLGR